MQVNIQYISLIRSKLEYSSSVWDPHLRKDIHHLEMVQRRAARFIKRDYSYESSVTQMLKDLDLSSLENRRKMNKLTVLYKIRNNLNYFYVSKKMDTLKEQTHALVTPAEIISSSRSCVLESENAMPCTWGMYKLMSSLNQKKYYIYY